MPPCIDARGRHPVRPRLHATAQHGHFVTFLEMQIIKTLPVSFPALKFGQSVSSSVDIAQRGNWCILELREVRCIP